LAVAAAGSVLVLAFFLFVDLGGPVTGTVHAASLVAAVVWAGPFWVYARMVRTPAISLCGGAALLAATTALLVALFRDTHSTAGIGVATIPMFLYPLAAGVLAIDRLLFARRTGEPLLRGFARRLLAVGLSFVVVVAAIFTVVGVVGLFDPVTPRRSCRLCDQHGGVRCHDSRRGARHQAPLAETAAVRSTGSPRALTPTDNSRRQLQEAHRARCVAPDQSVGFAPGLPIVAHPIALGRRDANGFIQGRFGRALVDDTEVVKRMVVVALAKIDEAIDELLYRPAIVKALQNGTLFVGLVRASPRIHEGTAGEHGLRRVVVRRVPVERALRKQLLASRRKPHRAQSAHRMAARPETRQLLPASGAAVRPNRPLLLGEAPGTGQPSKNPSDCTHAFIVHRSGDLVAPATGPMSSGQVLDHRRGHVHGLEPGDEMSSSKSAVRSSSPALSASSLARSGRRDQMARGSNSSSCW
jgi:hypothetical protein